MEIAVEGWRPSATDWDAVRRVPPEELPPLTSAQREVVQKLGMSAEEYARGALAGRRSQAWLLEKTERLAHLLKHKIESANLPLVLKRVVLNTIEEKFTVELDSDGRPILLRIDENLVDDYFERGSEEAEQRLARILDRGLMGVTT
jgi:hypothetical protein